MSTGLNPLAAPSFEMFDEIELFEHLPSAFDIMTDIEVGSLSDETGSLSDHTPSAPLSPSSKYPVESQRDLSEASAHALVSPSPFTLTATATDDKAVSRFSEMEMARGDTPLGSYAVPSVTSSISQAPGVPATGTLLTLLLHKTKHHLYTTTY